MNEKEFESDLQQFAKFFKSIELGVDSKDIKPENNGNYHTFTFKSMQIDTEENSRKFSNILAEDVKRDELFFSGKNLWILKPSGLNRGKGLELFSSLQELDDFLRLYTTGYDVKEFISMQYNDNDNVSPSLVKSNSQQKLGVHECRTFSNRSQRKQFDLELDICNWRGIKNTRNEEIHISEFRNPKVP